MQLRKNKKQITRSNSTNSHYLNKKPISFQTIYKRRNETISDSQLQPDHSQPSHCHPSSTKSQIITPQIRQLEKSLISPPLGIKDYVKKMVNKEDKQVQHRTHYQRLYTNEDDDKQSRKSVRTTRSSKSTQFLSKKQSSAPVAVEVKTIQDLERKIDLLVNQTLLRLKKQRSSIGITKSLCNTQSSKTGLQFYKQLEQIYQIIGYFKMLASQKQRQRESQDRQRIEDLDRKLQMIEKMMASQNIQSEVLKSQYFNWKSQRMNTSSFANKKMLATQNKFNYEGVGARIKKIGFQDQPSKKQIVSNYHSTNSIHFTKPARKYYIGPQQKKNTFSINRQPMPRSNYATQFLNYGTIPIYNYKESHLKQQPEMSLAIKASNYQQQYKDKLSMTKNIDFKELDCFKDKFKNTNISFMNASKKQTTQKIKLDQKLHKKNMNDSIKENIERLSKIRASEEALLTSLTLSKHIPSLKTEAQKEFIWFNNKNTNDHYVNDASSCLLRSEIKDKRLQKFKQTFKQLAMRR